MIKEKKTYKNIKTDELIFVEFVIGNYVVYTKDWYVYKLNIDKFKETYEEI